MMLKTMVPGGAHTYSKSNMAFPANAPEFIDKCQGCYATDNHKIRYIDWGMGLRSVVIGHADPRVNTPVVAALRKGVNFTRPGVLEYKLAEKFRELHGRDTMVKFGKSGSDATSAAVRLARAYTGFRYVLVPEENPFISQHDWFIQTTNRKGGTLDDQFTIRFSYAEMQVFHDGETMPLQQFLNTHDTAILIIDPSTLPKGMGKLQMISEWCREAGTLFMLDEMIAGCRYSVKGMQGLEGCPRPDLSSYGKALGNGYSISALVGHRDIMKLGDITKHDVFLMSGTHFAETTGLAAALAVIELLEYDNCAYLYEVGTKLMTGIEQLIEHRSMGDEFSVNYDYACNPSIRFANATVKTFFDQIMVQHNVLMPYIAPSYSHTEREISRTLDVVDAALKICSENKHKYHRYIMDEHRELSIIRSRRLFYGE